MLEEGFKSQPGFSNFDGFQLREVFKAIQPVQAFAVKNPQRFEVPVWRTEPDILQTKLIFNHERSKPGKTTDGIDVIKP